MVGVGKLVSWILTPIFTLGRFVQENWMVPSLFICASEPRSAEIDIASGWGSVDNARAVLERHWDTFINQTDFEYLAAIGINTVRLPIGYWTLGPTFVTGTPFEPYASVYTNSWPRFVRAINMAAQSGIGVLVDVHGAVGSQNGQPHSGISDGQTRLFNSSTYMDKTMEFLMFLTAQLQNVTNIVGIEILNEPNDTPELLDFCKHASFSCFCAVGDRSASVYRHESDHGYETKVFRGSQSSALHS
jgi:glucan 1,3-beta-glucosidase